MAKTTNIERLKCPKCKFEWNPLIFLECPYCQLNEYALSPLLKESPEYKSILKDSLKVMEGVIDKEFSKADPNGWAKLKEIWMNKQTKTE